MSQENQITLRGYLTAEPKFYQKTPQAVPLTEMRVGCTPRRLNRATGEWQNLPTSYYRVKCWRRLAINTASSLKKGDQVVIRGHFYMNYWIDSQQRQRSTLEIEADTVGHDLAYGWSHFMHGARPSGNSAAVNAGEVARQDTATAASGEQQDEEHIPDIEGTGPDETGEAPPLTAAPADDEGDDEGEGAGEGDTPEAAEAPDASGVTADIDSLVREVDALEREAVPF